MGTKEQPDFETDCYITVSQSDFDNILSEFIVEPVVNPNRQVIELSIYHTTRSRNHPNNVLLGYILEEELGVINGPTRTLLRDDKINKVVFSVKL